MPRAAGSSEAFSRVRIDSQLKDVGWDVMDGRSVRYEYPLSDGTRHPSSRCSSGWCSPPPSQSP